MGRNQTHRRTAPPLRLASKSATGITTKSATTNQSGCGIMVTFSKDAANTNAPTMPAGTARIFLNMMGQQVYEGNIVKAAYGAAGGSTLSHNAG